MTSPTVDDLLNLGQDFRQRLRVAVGQPKSAVRRPAPWFEIRNQAGEPGVEVDEVDIYLYDVIGGWCGITAQDFVAALRDIDSPVINVHINSPGGDVFDGIAIFQALRNHSARIVTYVDSLAASAASFIAMAGDKRIIAPYGSLMIHDAWGMCVGNAADMAKMTDELDRLSGTIAQIYADRGTGGTRDEWRAAMHAETWYSAAEAVEAGLMHEQQEDVEKTTDEPAAKAKNRWDLSVFNYAGRDKAPAPRFPGRAAALAVPRAEVDAETEPVSDEQPAAGSAAPADESAPQTTGAEPEASNTEPKESPVATLSTDVLARLDLAEDADDGAVLAAIDGLKAKAETPTQPDPAFEAAAKAQADENTELRKTVDVLSNKVEAMSTELAATKAEKAAATKKTVLDAAQAAGKFAPAERAQWDADYDEAPAAVTRMLDRIAPGAAVPVNAAGHTGGDVDLSGNVDEEYEALVASIDPPRAGKEA